VGFDISPTTRLAVLLAVLVLTTAIPASEASTTKYRYAVSGVQLPSYAGIVEILGPKGHVQVVLSRGNAAWPQARWSPPESMVAWVDHQGLKVARPDGSRRRSLVSASRRCMVCEPLTFAWSPSGRQLLVGGAGAKTNRLLTVAVRTGARSNLFVPRPYTEYRVLGWSPNGRWIAFSRSTGKPGTSSCCTLGLFVARPDGTGARRVFRFEDPIHDTPFGSWSPDSRSIAFTSDRTGLVIVNARSGSVRRIAGISPLIVSPAWSPDSKRLAVIAGQVLTLDPNEQNVHQLGAKGGHLVVWTHNGALFVVSGAQSNQVLVIRDGRERPQLLFRMPKKQAILALDPD
jgi:Tol biopolymer transport system component